jgi:hypothetical protein
MAEVPSCFANHIDDAASECPSQPAESFDGKAPQKKIGRQKKQGNSSFF